MLEKLRRKAKGKRKLGFTLVEVTISIVIASIIGLATFAIVSSALDTFHRQQDVIDAIEVKEMVLSYTKDHLRTCSDMRLREYWNKDMGANIIYDSYGTSMLSGGDVAPPDIDNTPDIDTSGEPHIIDKKIMQCNMVYSLNGRVYMINNNNSGRIDYGIDTDYPAETDDLEHTFAKAYPLFDDVIYGNYDVRLQFKPIFTAQQGTYRDIQLIVEVMKKGSSEVIVQGTETFHLLNVENRKKEIEFFDDNRPSIRSYEVYDAPVFSYCYFA